MTGARYYSPSSQVGIGAALVVLIGGAVGAAVLGAGYGAYMWHMRELAHFGLMLTFFAPVIYGVLLGVAVGKCARMAKVRNAKAVGRMALVISLFGSYTGWVAWLYFDSGQTYIAPLGPGWWFEVVMDVAGEGITYTPKAHETGSTLYWLWGLEALLIYTLCWTIAHYHVAGGANPFCEACGVWAKQVFESPELEAGEDAAEFRAGLEADPVARLKDVAVQQGQPPVPGSTWQANIHQCPKCENFLTLNVAATKRWQGNDGQSSRTEPVVEHLLVDNRALDLMRHRFASGNV